MIYRLDGVNGSYSEAGVQLHLKFLYRQRVTLRLENFADDGAADPSFWSNACREILSR